MGKKSRAHSAAIEMNNAENHFARRWHCIPIHLLLLLSLFLIIYVDNQTMEKIDDGTASTAFQGNILIVIVPPGGTLMLVSRTDQPSNNAGNHDIHGRLVL